MTVTSTVARNDYVGTGSVAAYAFTFPVLTVDDVAVFVTDASGAQTTLARGVDFTVALESNRAGTVTLTDGNLASGSALAIVDNQALKQESSLTQAAKYSPVTVERALDHLTMQTRTLAERIRHAIRLPMAENLDALLGSAVDRASKYLGFDPSGIPTLASPPRTTTGSGGGGIGLSVLDAGATGGGLVLDTVAIQATIDAVNSAGGGTVFLPEGTFLIDIAQTAVSTFKHALTLYPGIVLRGASRERTVLKLKNGAGNYNAIFSRALASDGDMNDVGIYDLTVDQNNAGNIPATLPDLADAGNARYAFVCFGGFRITVENCWFKNFKSINTLSFNAPVGLCSHIQVVGNRFDHAVSAAINNDHSTIYTSCTDVVIADNIFTAPAANTYGATCAIELHGSNQLAHHNIIKNFQIGCNLTGIADASDNLHFDHNIIDGSLYGLTIWSYFFGANTNQPALTNCSITNNLIRLNRDAWPLSTYPLSYGIATEQLGYAPMRGIKIKGNQIYFAASAIDFGLPDQYSCGVDWERGTGGHAVGGLGYDQDIEITDNTIVGAYAAGIRAIAAVRNLTITDNKIRDCGSSAAVALSNPAYRSGVMTFPNGALIGWNVSRNTFTDRRATPGMTYGLFIGEGTAIHCRAEDNIFDVADTHPHPFAIANFVTDSSWYLRHVCRSYNVDVSGLFRTGSSIIETDTGITRTQIDTPEGANWLQSVPRFFPGFEIAWGMSDASGALESSPDFMYVGVGSAQVISGGTLPGSFVATGAAGAAKGYNWRTGLTDRQSLLMSGAEAGADAGASVSMLNFTDAGAFIDASMTWNRKAGTDVQVNRNFHIATGFVLKINFLQVVTTRKTGWSLPTGTLSRATFDQSTVTLPELAKRLAALITDLEATAGHGLIGA